MTVTKARIAGMDKDVTKTGNDRRILLSPRAVAVLDPAARPQPPRDAAGIRRLEGGRPRNRRGGN